MQSHPCPECIRAFAMVLSKWGWSGSRGLTLLVKHPYISYTISQVLMRFGHKSGWITSSPDGVQQVGAQRKKKAMEESIITVERCCVQTRSGREGGGSVEGAGVDLGRSIRTSFMECQQGTQENQTSKIRPPTYRSLTLVVHHPVEPVPFPPSSSNLTSEGVLTRRGLT